MPVKAERFIVPKSLMAPLGAKATSELGKCADTWNDSEVASLRAELPSIYHAVPLDQLRRQWVNIRKSGKAEGYHVNGKGPAPGSRRKRIKLAVPKWYKLYLQSEDWKRRKTRWLEFWGYRCAICNGHGENSILDVHHRTYERCGTADRPGTEELTDCIVLCRQCHELYESELKVPDDDPNNLQGKLSWEES